MGDGTDDAGDDAAGNDAGDPRRGRLQCPFCNSYDIARLFVASLGLDSCRCATCAGCWDEERSSGRYRGSSDTTSILMRSTG